MSGPAQLETEQKITLSPLSLERVFDVLAPLAEEINNKHYPRLYFDTHDLALNRRMVAVRIQHKDGRYEQMIKVAHNNIGASLVRSEWPSVVAENRPDFSVVTDDAAQKALSGIVDDDLMPVFTSDVHRRYFDLALLGGAIVEVAFDVGEIILAPPFEAVRASFCEVEVELKSGNPTAIDPFVSDILAMADDARVSMTSKAERGFALYKDALSQAG